MPTAAPATASRPSSSSARRRQRAARPHRGAAAATQLLVHVRDYTKGHPSIAANNHPVRHGPVVGIHNGIIVNDDEILADFPCARSEPEMTVDSEAIFARRRALAQRRRAPSSELARRDGDRLARRARAGRPLPRPRRAAGRSGSARAARASSSPRRRLALEVVERYCGSAAQAGARRGHAPRPPATARSSREERFRPDSSYVEERSAARRSAPRASARFCLTRLAALAAAAVAAATGSGRRCATSVPSSTQPLAGSGTGTSTRRRGGRRTSGRPATRSAATRPRLRAAAQSANFGSRPSSRASSAPWSTARSSRSSPTGDVEARLAQRRRERAERVPVERLRRHRAAVRVDVARGRIAPSSSPSSRSSAEQLRAGREAARHQPGRALRGVPAAECSITVCGCTCVPASAANSFIVGERPEPLCAGAELVEDLLVGVAPADPRLERRELRRVDRRHRAGSVAFRPCQQW